MLQSEKALLRWRLAYELDREDVYAVIMSRPVSELWLGSRLYRMSQYKKYEGGGLYFHLMIERLGRFGPGDANLRYNAWELCLERGKLEQFERTLFQRSGVDVRDWVDSVFLDVFMEDARAHFSQVEATA